MVALINAIAVEWHLYHYIWWLDMPMHVISGMWVALMGLTLYYRGARPVLKTRSTEFVIAFALATVLIVGLAWEVYEFAIGHMIANTVDGLRDTLSDLCDDFIGGLLGAGIFLIKRYNRDI